VTRCTDKCLPSSYRKRGGKVNIELHIDWLTAKPTALPIAILPYESRVQEYFIPRSLFNDIQFNIFFDFLFSTLSVFKLNRFASILHTWFSLIDRFRRFSLNYCLKLCGLKLGIRQTMHIRQAPNPWQEGYSSVASVFSKVP
jgi:hypothetical protein